MASRPQQQSATSLARYASARQPDVDVFNGSSSRDFCNSFWGLGDAGPNIMFARMRGASKTTDELRNFWNERCIIEEEYATRLAKLAKAPIGGDEIGELRNSLDTLRIETTKQAESHLELAHQIRLDIEGPTAEFHQKQITHRRTVQAPLEKKFKEKQVLESYVKKSREKYEGDCVRVNSYTQQATYMQGTDLQKVQQKLERTKQTMLGNQRDFAKFTKDLLDLLPIWEQQWKDFCDSCQDLEEERVDKMKDIIWAYANSISTICVIDDQSCEGVRTALDNVDYEKDVLNFVNEFGTGNSIAIPAEFTPSNSLLEPQLPGPPIIQTVQHQRICRREAPTYNGDPAAQVGATDGASPHHPDYVNGDSQSYNDSAPYTTRTSPPPTSPPNQPIPPIPPLPELVTTASLAPAAVTSTSNSRPSSSARHHRESQPLPLLPEGGSSRGPERSQTPPPPLPVHQGSRILFYVKALYDYTATIDEEFDFQSGDVIAVTEAPDDGWWSGELLDEARRVEGRNVFPSNFVCLF